MADTPTADDPRYREMFDAAKEAASFGAVIEGDLTEKMSVLRNTAPVMKGSRKARTRQNRERWKITPNAAPKSRKTPCGA